VTVSDLSGDAFAFNMAGDSSIQSVKERIQRLHGYPIASQKIIIKESTADDRKSILTYSEDGAACLDVKVLLCDSELFAQLVQTNAKEARLEAIRSLLALSRLRRTGQDAFVQAMCDCLEDRDDDIKSEAAGALQSVVSKEDATALTEVALRLSHPESHVRCAAAACLALLVQRGDEHATDTLTEILCDESYVVQVAACEALSKVSSHGNRVVVLALLKALRSPNIHVRKSAADSIGELAVRGDSTVTESLAECLLLEQHAFPSSEVAVPALSSLRKVALVGDKAAIDCLRTLLLRWQMFVVSSSHELAVALHTLAAIAEGSDSSAGAVIESTVDVVKAKAAAIRGLHEGLENSMTALLKSAMKALSNWHQRASV